MATTQQLKTPVYHPFFDDREVQVKQKNRKATTLASTEEANNSKKISAKTRIKRLFDCESYSRIKMIIPNNFLKGKFFISKGTRRSQTVQNYTDYQILPLLQLLSLAYLP